MIFILLQNEVVQIVLIIIACFFALNVFSDFTEKIRILFVNIRSFLFYLPILIYKLFRFIFRSIYLAVFWPILIIKSIKKNLYIESLIINNSMFKEIL